MADEMHERGSNFREGAVSEIESVDRYDAIRELIRKSRVFRSCRNKKLLESAVVAREQVMSTALGRGVAVAHGNTDAVPATLVALGISRHGIAYDAPDGHPVHFLFLVAHPPRLHDEYLSVLSAIARMICDETMRNDLLATDRMYEIDEKIGRAFTCCIDQAHRFCPTVN